MGGLGFTVVKKLSPFPKVRKESRRMEQKTKKFTKSLLGISEPAQLPAPQPPLATPQVEEGVKDIARRKRPRGFRETFLTGDLIPTTEKKQKLGSER